MDRRNQRIQWVSLVNFTSFPQCCQMESQNVNTRTTAIIQFQNVQFTEIDPWNYSTRFCHKQFGIRWFGLFRRGPLKSLHLVLVSLIFFGEDDLWPYVSSHRKLFYHCFWFCIDSSLKTNKQTTTTIKKGCGWEIAITSSIISIKSLGPSILNIWSMA